MLLKIMAFGASSFFLGGPGIALVAWLILFSVNTAMPQLNKQAAGVTSQFQGLASNALPAIISQPEILVNGSPVQQQNSANSSTFGGGDLGQNDQQFVSIPTAYAPPVVGQISWVGSVSPAYNAELLPYQVSCFYNQQAQQTMFMNGYVPSGMTVSIVALKTALQTVDNESWELRISYPHDQIPQQVYTIDGVNARAIKKALGGETVTGTSPWPVIQQTWDGAKNVITNPVVCDYR